MSKPSSRPYIPCGSYENKNGPGGANDAAKERSKDTGENWISCKNPNGKGYAIVRKS